MSPAAHCRTMADEAERLAAIVSYGRDKERLQQQAASWRAKAAALDAEAPSPETASHSAGVFAWLRRRCA